MNIEDARIFALSLNSNVTEDLFANEWVSFRIGGKWFMLMQLDAPEPRVAVKLLPSVAEELREQYDGIRPAYHMNKKHWNDLYLDELNDSLIKSLITESFNLVYKKLPKTFRGKKEKERQTPHNQS